MRKGEWDEVTVIKKDGQFWRNHTKDHKGQDEKREHYGNSVTYAVAEEVG